MTTPLAPLRILVLSDGKAGHVTGSLGTLASIAKLRPVEPVTVQVRLRLKGVRHLLRRLVNRPRLLARIPAGVQRALIRLCYRLSDPRPLAAAGAFDWLVSAGGDTAVLNAWLAQLLGVRNIYCSSLRGVAPECFQLVLTLGAEPPTRLASTANTAC